VSLGDVVRLGLEIAGGIFLALVVLIGAAIWRLMRDGTP